MIDNLYFSTQLDDQKTLCLAPITDRNIELSGEIISDPSGYFLYEKSGPAEDGQVEIIAQIRSTEAVLRLREMLRMT